MAWQKRLLGIPGELYHMQVETRIIIAAVGLMILLLISSAAFWLTLLSFATIAAADTASPYVATLSRHHHVAECSAEAALGRA